MNHEATQDTRDRLIAAGAMSPAAAAGLPVDAAIVAAVAEANELAAEARNLCRPKLIPAIGDAVHYRAYGTPGGEFPAACRAAIVTGTGAWVNTYEGPSPATPGHGDVRTVLQRWHDDAISATVHNPSGEYRGILVHDPTSDPRGGTWHRPGVACRPGGTR